MVWIQLNFTQKQIAWSNKYISICCLCLIEPLMVHAGYLLHSIMTTTRNEAAEVNSSRTQGQPSPWEDILGHLSQPDQLADIIIDVEGHQLYTSKYMLASVSSKFRQIFTDTAAESPNILPLPGVSLQAAVDLLRWLLPLETLTISGEIGVCFGIHFHY